MKNLCVIPARGGSKRIPKKNIKEFCGKPLIAYSIETALKSNLFEKVIVSTDDDEISKISKKYGAEVLKRPEELADDMTHVGPVIEHAVSILQKNDENYNFICILYATAPFLQKKYLIEGYEVLKNSDACGSFGVTNFEYPIWRSFRITKDNRCEMFWRDNFSKRSQDLEEAYHDAGQFGWQKIGCKSSDIPIGKDAIPIDIPRYLVQDIDTPEDFKRAELMYNALVKDKIIKK